MISGFERLSMRDVKKMVEELEQQPGSWNVEIKLIKQHNRQTKYYDEYWGYIELVPTEEV